MEIFTLSSNPFKIGGTHDLIKTTIEKYERISLGKGIYGILVYNPIKNIWHMAEEQTGALVGTAPLRDMVIERVKNDVGRADEKMIQNQIESQKGKLSQALSLSNEEFFGRFKG